MLKKISVSQVRLGMHLHALEGAWIDHPFWKTRFIIRDREDLAKLQVSGLTGVWIDVSKGLDVVEAGGELARPKPGPRVQAAAASDPTPAGGPPTAASRSLKEELAHAVGLWKDSSAQVSSMFAEARMGKAVDAEQCMPLVNDIAGSVFRNPGALVSLARLKTQDDYTYMHSVATCALMVALGRALQFSDDQCRLAGMAGLLHDLGKAMMPLDVLNKPGKLTDEEFAIMRGHPSRGHEMLQEARGMAPEVLDVVLHHHERMDGTGYPDRLAEGSLSLLARMGAVCDVYDAVTSNRPYKAGWDPAESIARMASWKGHFDPAVFQAFVRSLGIYPTGSLVKLQSGRLAVVVEQNPAALVSPTVKVFFSTRSQMPIAPQLLDLARSNDKIVGRENPQTWGFKHLDGLWAGDALDKR